MVSRRFQKFIPTGVPFCGEGVTYAFAFYSTYLALALLCSLRFSRSRSLVFSPRLSLSFSDFLSLTVCPLSPHAFMLTGAFQLLVSTPLLSLRYSFR